MKYFRTYPWGIQLLWFLLIIISIIVFASFMVLSLLPKISPYDITQLGTISESSPAGLIRTSIIVQAISSMSIFLIPGLLFAHLCHPRPAQYLGFRAPGKSIQIVLSILLMLGAMPVLQVIESAVSLINFGPEVKADQETMRNTFRAYLHLPDFATLLRTFVVLAIVPAIGEEVFFRGLLLRFAKQRSTTVHFPVAFSALIFALVHFNVYGFVSIFFAGILLAAIYYLTGSLWCSILAHVFFNGSQVILAYVGNNNAAVKAFINDDSVPYYYVIAGVVLFSVSLYLLLKNRTPLPANWTDDFTPEELSQKED